MMEVMNGRRERLSTCVVYKRERGFAQWRVHFIGKTNQKSNERLVETMMTQTQKGMKSTKGTEKRNKK